MADMTISGVTLSGGYSITLPPAGIRAIFGYGVSSVAVAITNMVSNTGVVGNDVTGVGTARQALAAASYGS